MENAQKKVLDEIGNLKSLLLSSLDEKIFFSELARFFMQKVDADRILIYKICDNNDSRLVATEGRPLMSSDQAFKGSGLASYVARTKRAYYSNNIKRDPLFAEFVKDINCNAELCVPITCKGTVLATIHLLSPSMTRNFSESDVNYVSDILEMLETPIVNMSMFLSAKNLNETLLKKIKQRDSLSAGLTVTDDNYFKKSKFIPKEILGNSRVMKELNKMIDKVSISESNIVIWGESGTGKELVARKIHSNSPRKNKCYVVVNCGALQESLLESELFGHVKGAFTGAIADRPGIVETANGGTLFLDEVAELTPVIQTKLLRFLQEREAYRVGSSYPYHVDVRVITATNKDLKKEVEAGRFREDLYYRLNTITVEVPALKERGSEDIILLANHFLNDGKNVREQKILSSKAAKILSDYTWPGNVRELQNIMERGSIMCDGKFIDEFHLPNSLLNRKSERLSASIYREMTLELLEREHICRTLQHLRGNKTKTAKTLGITVKTLYNKLHSYGMIQTRENRA